MQGKADVLVTTKIKADSIFPLNQFKIQGYPTPCRFYRNRNRVSVLYMFRKLFQIGN